MWNPGAVRRLSRGNVQMEFQDGAAGELQGFLRLSLLTCPVALFPATSESEKVSFNQINKNTGQRIKYATRQECHQQRKRSSAWRSCMVGSFTMMK
jgi:hypothetical protein